MRSTRLAVCTVLALLLMAGVATPVLSDEDVLEIEVIVSPNTLVLDSEGAWVTVHTNIAYGAVVRATLELNGIPVAWTKYDNQGCLVGKFELDAVKDIVEPPSAVLTMTGVCVDGAVFSGTDIVTVRAGSGR